MPSQVETPLRRSSPRVTRRKKEEDSVLKSSKPATPAKKTSKSSSSNSIDKKLDEEIVYEFGGPVGVTFMMMFFPILMYYFFICLQHFNGKLWFPASFEAVKPFVYDFFNYLKESAFISKEGVLWYLGFVLLQALLSAVMPGPVIKGLPIPSEGNKQLDYLCNGVSAWYFTLALAFGSHYYNLVNLASIVDHYGSLLTVSILFGNFVTFVTYFSTILFGKPHRMSGNFFYDLFMGAPLNPRIGNLDLKMYAEIRIPWKILFFISLSCLLKQKQTLGYYTPELVFMTIAHFLYVNACMKGEECIPTTWDIFYEKWGFMLIFWNFSGVPFTYCYSSLYLLNNGPMNHTAWYYGLCFTMLLVGYYIWDTANSQKNRFRMQERGTFIPRYTFPQLPWGTLENPTFIKTRHGSKLLTGGWWGIARKIHYTADLMMALSWGLITGFGSFIPYFYFCFFLAVLVHRVTRDIERCSKKYGDDWERYIKEVPWIFIPGII